MRSNIHVEYHDLAFALPSASGRYWQNLRFIDTSQGTSVEFCLASDLNTPLTNIWSSGWLHPLGHDNPYIRLVWMGKNVWIDGCSPQKVNRPVLSILSRYRRNLIVCSWWRGRVSVGGHWTLSNPTWTTPKRDGSELFVVGFRGRKYKKYYQ